MVQPLPAVQSLPAVLQSLPAVVQSLPAVVQSLPAVVQSLLAVKNMDIDAADNDGHSPLFVASEAGQWYTAALLSLYRKGVSISDLPGLEKEKQLLDEAIAVNGQCLRDEYGHHKSERKLIRSGGPIICFLHSQDGYREDEQRLKLRRELKLGKLQAQEGQAQDD
ncbi:MAG: hypothetical protein LQ343_000156 [Gyalolechia ehrenbergii]|nr:MAG: hypothetical protein LQ343_000156 [Gyalolechia ehrenbergii]